MGMILMGFKTNFYNGSVITDLVVARPDVYTEKRGQIWTSFLQQEFVNYVPFEFVHDKFSTSTKNVLRGIHGDHKSWKLISCPYGDISAVIVDMRSNSETYLKYERFELNSENRLHILIPPGIGNSFYVNSDVAVYHYKLAYEGDYIDADQQFTIKWNDLRLNINWPSGDPILSDRDELIL